MKTLLVMGLLALSTTAFSSVVKSYDAERSCNLYRVVDTSPTAKKSEKIRAGEVVVISKRVYGLSFHNMEINFDNREAKVEITVNIVLGLNQPLVNEKAVIAEENPQFSTLINQLNRKLSLLETVCLSSDNKIVYAEVFKTE